MKKCINMMKKCFLFQKMDECRNAMLHQILSDRHPDTFSKSKKKGCLVHFKTLNLGAFQNQNIKFE